MRNIVLVGLLSLAYAGSLLGAEGVDVSALSASLKDGQVFVRAAAALALGNKGPAAESAVPVLVQALADPDLAVRTRAADALAQINRNPDLVIPALVRLAQSANASDRVIAADTL